MTQAGIAPVHYRGKLHILIEIEGLFGRGSIGIIFGLLKQLIEFSFEHLLMALVLRERFLEYLIPPRLFSLKLLDSRSDVLNRGRFFVLAVTDDGLKLGINLKCRFAARAAHLHQVAFSFGHTANLSRLWLK
jgi:hypothetical protein